MAQRTTAQSGFHSESESGHQDRKSSHGASVTGTFTGTILQLTGFGLLALGVALRFATQYSWQLEQLGDRFKSEGISPTFVAFAGFVAFGFGLIHRATRRMESGSEQTEDFSDAPDFGLVATEFAGGLHQVQEAVKTLGQHLTLSNHEQRVFQETMLNEFAKESNESSQNDPMFRLAAGIDHLHEVIDKKIQALTEETSGKTQQVEELVQSLAQQFSQVQTELKGVMDDIRLLPSTISTHAAAFGTVPVAAPASAAPAGTPTIEPAVHQSPSPTETVSTGQSRDIYAEPPACPATIESEALPLEGQSIDTDRMVEEGLEVLVQLEEGRSPNAHEPSQSEDEFFERFQSQASGTSPQGAQPNSKSQPNPPAPLPSPKPGREATREENLDTLLPDKTLRDALGGGS